MAIQSSKTHRLVTVATKAEALKVCATRGFSSFADWKRQNREGQSYHKLHGNRELLEALEHDAAYFLSPRTITP